LDVPWTSEWTIWFDYPQGCGPTALWMLLAFHLGRSSVLLLPKEEIPDAEHPERPANKSVITRLMEIPPAEGGYDPSDAKCEGANKACTSPPALVKVAKSYGLGVNEHSNWNLDQVVESLRANKPVLVANRLNFAGATHYFVVVGIQGDELVYNDSYAYDEAEGKLKRGKLASFMKAWYTNIDAGLDPTNMAGWNGWGMAVQ